MGQKNSRNNLKTCLDKKCPVKLLIQALGHSLNYDLEGFYLKAENFPLSPSVDKRIVIKKPIFFEESVYIGELKDNIPDGLGYMITETGLYYEGYFKAGKFDGHGRIFNSNSWIIEGTWEEGLLNTGKITNFNQKIFQGDLLNLKPHGNGKETGHYYEYIGEFSHGKKHGKGKITWIDKTSYSGDFNSGKIEGFGIHVWEDSQYNGEFKAGKMHGEGVYTWNDGRKYEGCFHAGLREGYGVYFNGKSTYKGYWKAGKEDGKGQLESDEGIVKGIWRNGKFQKDKKEIPDDHFYTRINLSEVLIPERFIQKCSKTLEFWKTFPKFLWDQPMIKTNDYWRHFSNGTYYGEVNDQNLPHGLGIYLTSGWIYEGNFSNGLRSGFGRQVCSNLESFIGDWVDDKKSGFGVFKKKKNVYVGEWKDDLFDGTGRLKTRKFEYDGSWRRGLQHGLGVMINPDKTQFHGMFLDGLVTGQGTLIYPNGKEVEGEWKDGKIVKITKKARKQSGEKLDLITEKLLKGLIQVRSRDLNGNF